MQNPEQIVSWVTENNYDKSKEFIYFFLSLSIPTLISYFIGLKRTKSEGTKRESRAKEKNFSYFNHLVIPIGLYFLLLNLNINGQIDLYHEGERLQLSGIPYKDFYLQHGLILNYLLPKFSCYFFTDSLEGVRRVFSLLEPLAYIILYFVGLNFFNSKTLLALLPPLFCSGVAYWIGLREGLCIAVLLAMLNQRIFIAGALSGLAFWFSIDYGLYAIFSCLSINILCLVFDEKSSANLKKYLFGLTLAIAPVLLAFSIIGNLNDFIANLSAQLSYQSTVWGKPFMSFDFDIWSEGFRVYSSILILIISSSFIAYKLAKRELFNSERNTKLLSITIFAIFFFRTALGRSDYGHWIDGSSLIILLLFAPFDFYIFSSTDKRQKAIALICFCLLLGYLNIIHQPFTKIKNRLQNFLPQRIETSPIARIGKIQIPEAQLNTIIEVKKFIDANTDRGEQIYDFANQGAYYFLLNRTSPTKYYNIVYAATEAMQQEVINDLELKRPKLIIFSTGTIYDGIDGIPASKRHKLVYNYILNNYHQAQIINNTKILLRN